MLALAAALATLAGVAPASRPAIHQWRIPFGARREREMAAYSRRHYGRYTFRLVHPHVIVEHISVAPTARADFDIFAPDVADPELHELPGVCAHYVVGARGDVHLLVSTSIRCRHTVGLNWTAIGVEHVGTSDAAVLGRPRVLRASLRLAAWLRCRYGIRVRDVIGHAESLSSPYHHERVAALRSQTHGDMGHATMQRYRARLARRRCP